MNWTRAGSRAGVDRSEIVLAALAAGGSSAEYSPIQFQKLLFLIDREIPDYIGGPHFNFQPYHYGPYDQSVFEVAELLAEDGKVIIDDKGPYRHYFLSEAGLNDGLSVLERIPRTASRYMAEASKWVLRQSFRTLLSAIYRHYPDMAIKSVMPELASQGQQRARQRRMHPFLKGMASVIHVPHNSRGEDLSEEAAADRDAVAVASVWRAVGDDLRFAIRREHAARH